MIADLLASNYDPIKFESFFVVANILTSAEPNLILLIIRECPFVLRSFFQFALGSNKHEVISQAFDVVQHLCEFDIALNLDGQNSLKFYLGQYGVDFLEEI